jgi:hypothetical protein
VRGVANALQTGRSSLIGLRVLAMQLAVNLVTTLGAILATHQSGTAPRQLSAASRCFRPCCRRR